MSKPLTINVLIDRFSISEATKIMKILDDENKVKETLLVTFKTIGDDVKGFN